jgi:hypothetical protein
LIFQFRFSFSCGFFVFPKLLCVSFEIELIHVYTVFFILVKELGWKIREGGLGVA